MIIASEFKIPVLLCSPGNGKFIEGEVFEVDDACLSSLDEMEHHPRWLQRQEISVQMISDKDDNEIEVVEKRVMAYLLNGFLEHLLDVPSHHVWDPDNIPEQRYEGTLPIDDDEQETLMMEKVSRSVLKNPDRVKRDSK